MALMPGTSLFASRCPLAWPPAAVRCPLAARFLL